MVEGNKEEQADEKHAGGSIVDTPQANMSTEHVRKENERLEREQAARKPAAE